MDGFLCVNKPRGVNSSKVVARVKYLTGCKVGHLGTLDPLAEGVLPIAIGKATRLFNYFLNKNKVYIASCEFGYETPTLDQSSEPNKNCKKIPSYDEISAILSKFRGKIQQIPPDFSAKKVNGKRAYDLARSGNNFKLKAKEIQILDLKLISYIKGKLTLQIHCSAGTYVRAIFRDIAYALDSLATTTSILRVASGPFNISSSLKFDELSLDAIEDSLIPMQKVLAGIPKIELSETDEENLLCGRLTKINCNDIDNVLFLTSKNAIYGLGSVKSGKISIKTYLLTKN